MADQEFMELWGFEVRVELKPSELRRSMLDYCMLAKMLPLQVDCRVHM